MFTERLINLIGRQRHLISINWKPFFSIYRLKSSQFEFEKSFLIKASGKIDFCSNDTFYIGHGTAVAKFKIQNKIQNNLIDDWVISEGLWSWFQGTFWLGTSSEDWFAKKIMEINNEIMIAFRNKIWIRYNCHRICDKQGRYICCIRRK